MCNLFQQAKQTDDLILVISEYQKIGTQWFKSA